MIPPCFFLALRVLNLRFWRSSPQPDQSPCVANSSMASPLSPAACGRPHAAQPLPPGRSRAPSGAGLLRAWEWDSSRPELSWGSIEMFIQSQPSYPERLHSSCWCVRGQTIMNLLKNWMQISKKFVFVQVFFQFLEMFFQHLQ